MINQGSDEKLRYSSDQMALLPGARTRCEEPSRKTRRGPLFHPVLVSSRSNQPAQAATVGRRGGELGPAALSRVVNLGSGDGKRSILRAVVDA